MASLLNKSSLLVADEGATKLKVQFGSEPIDTLNRLNCSLTKDPFTRRVVYVLVENTDFKGGFVVDKWAQITTSTIV